MKKTNHPRWPQPLLGMAPIRLRPMGWLDDLLPMRPPSLWRDISVQRGLQWSPNLADLSWLFAAYSMLGVELPMPRVQHRTHISSRRQPIRRRRTNARTLLQQRGNRKKNIAIPSWRQKKAVHIAPSERKETRVEHASRSAPQRKTGFSSGNLPAFQWKGGGFQRPQTSSPSNLQLVKRIINQETETLRSKTRREEEDFTTGKSKKLSRQTSTKPLSQKRSPKQATETLWKLKPSSTIRRPKEVERARIGHTVLNPVIPVLQQRQIEAPDERTPTKQKRDLGSKEETRRKKTPRQREIDSKREIKRPKISSEVLRQLRFSVPKRFEEETQRQKPKKISLSPPPVRRKKEWVEKFSAVEKAKSKRSLRAEEDLPSLVSKRVEDIFEPTTQRRKATDTEKTEELGRLKPKEASFQAEGKRLRKTNFFISPERTRQFRFSVPQIQETVQPKTVRPQFSLTPLPLLRKDSSIEAPEDSKTKPKKPKITETDPVVRKRKERKQEERAQKRKVPNLRLTPEKITKLQFSHPETPITRPKPRKTRQLSLALPKNYFRPQATEEAISSPSGKRAPFSIQKILQKRAAQIFQREETSFRKPRSQREEGILSPRKTKQPSILQSPIQGKNREDISWGREDEQRSVQTPNLAKPVLLKKMDASAPSPEQVLPKKAQKRTEQEVSESRRPRIQQDSPIYTERKRAQKKIEERALSVSRKTRTISRDFQKIRKLRVEREQDSPQSSKFSVKEFQIVRKLRARKEKSLQAVPPIFSQKRASDSQADSQKKRGVQPTRILASKELPIVRKPSDNREEVARKPKVSPAEESIDASLQRTKRERAAPETTKRKIKVAPEVIQKLKKVKEFSFREAPQFSKKRQRLIRELQSGNKTRIGSSLQAFEKEIQIVRKQQEREEQNLQKKAAGISRDGRVQKKAKPSILRRVVWPSRSKSNLLRHFEIKRVKQRKENVEAVQHVPQAVHNFFSAPSTGKPQKRAQSPLLRLHSGTLVFPTPEFSVEDRRKPKKSDGDVTLPAAKKTKREEASQEVTPSRKRRAFPESYVAKKSVYRRAFTSTGASQRLRPQLRKEQDAILKSTPKRQIPTLVQTPLAWRAVWIETEQKTPKKPKQERENQEKRGSQKRTLLEQEIVQKVKKSNDSATTPIEQNRKRRTRFRRDSTPKIGRYGGLEREAAVFWTQERTMAVPPVVLQALRKQEAETSSPERITKKKILFSSDLPPSKRKQKRTAGSSLKPAQKVKGGRSSSPAVSKRQKRQYSIKELNWKPKRLALERPLEQKSKARKPAAVSAPVEQRVSKLQHFPIIENWRKPPVFSNPIQNDTSSGKRFSPRSSQRELVQARSISANIVFQPPPVSKKQEESAQTRPAKITPQNQEEVAKRRVLKRDESTEIVQKKKKSIPSPAGILRKRAKGYLRPGISIPKSYLPPRGSSSAAPRKRSSSSFEGSSTQERQVQFYRQAQQQTFLRPEQRPLDLQQIEKASKPKKEEVFEPQQKERAPFSRQVTQEQVSKKRVHRQVSSGEKSLSGRVFRAMEQVVGKKKPLSPSIQAERNFLRTASLEGGVIPPERRIRQERNVDEPIQKPKKQGSTRSILSPSRNPRHPVLSRAQTRPKNSFSTIETEISSPRIPAGESNLEHLNAKAMQSQPEEQEIEIIRKKRKRASSRKPVAPRVLGLGREIGVFLKPKKQVVIEEEEIGEKTKSLRVDQVSKNSDVFFIDPSGNLLQGEKATKRMKELGFARADSKPEPETPPQSKGLPTSYSWEASPEMVEKALSETRKQVKKQEKPRKIAKKVQPKRVISQMTEEELFTILTALTTSSPEAQEILRDVRLKVEEYFDYERFRKI